MSDALAKARAIAAAATPGPWHSDDYVGEWSVLRYGESPREFATDICDPDTMTEADAAHIARFDPPTVLVMLDALESAGEALRHSVYHTDLRLVLHMKDEVQLKSALERVRDLLGDNSAGDDDE